MNHCDGKHLTGFALLAAVALATIGTHHLFAQERGENESEPGKLAAYHSTEPWRGETAEATKAPTAATTIPMSTYSFAATKDGKTYSGTLVGTSPFAATKTSVTIPVVVVPLKVTIGTTVFDPSATNTCDGNISAVNRFNESPLVQVSPLKFNGVSVGTTQYINGFLRAEFWSEIGGSAAYQNTLTFMTAAEVSIAPTTAATAGTPQQASISSTGCTQLGIVSYSWLTTYLTGTLIPSLTKSGVIGPTKLVVFLLRNVVASTATPPTTTGCCVLGTHGAVGSPVQTYAVVDWDTTESFGSETDGAGPSHEIAEWMNDPLGTNPTPAWGDIGQESGCQTDFEVADPLVGTVMPAITLSGKAYHMQELAFFSWFYNKSTVASLGAGGKFSGNGTFKGPSKVCPPGGTN